jgi:polygalacturonase
LLAASIARFTAGVSRVVPSPLAPKAILAASTPDEGTTSGGYDPAEPNPWEEYQDYGHNHWHNSLIWGEDLHDVAIMGPGLIWGKGLSRGDKELPHAESPGVGNKAIALKNCRNVLLRDFSILKGGHFGILTTGVDNLTIDNLKIDTDRDGMDIDCCRNVRVSNCSINSPWDDGICPKSSFALGYVRPTENVTITNCYVTAAYELGTMLDGTWKRSGRSPTAASETSPFPTASLTVAGESLWSRLTALYWKMSPSQASPCAIAPTRQSSCVWVAECGAPKVPQSEH